MQWVGYSILGLFVGVVSGLVGIGGGILMVPAMVLLMGYTQHEAQGTSLAVMLPPVGVLAAWQYAKAGHVHWAPALFMSLFFVAGGYLGARFAVTIDQAILKKVFGAFMIVSGVYITFKQ